MEQGIDIVRVIRVQEWTGTREAIAAQIRRSLPDGQQWVDYNGARVKVQGRGADMRNGDLLMTTTTLQPWGGQVVTRLDAAERDED